MTPQQNEDIVFEVAESEGVPPGTYRGRHVEQEQVEDLDFADLALRFVFEVLAPADHEGRRTSALATLVDDKGRPRKPTAKNKLGKLLAGLKGAPIEVGEKINPSDYLGRIYLITVEPTKNGNGTTVSAIMQDMQ